MVGIVAHHYATHGWVMPVTESGNTAVFLSVVSGYGKWGVDLFVLVGSYFMVHRPGRGRALAAIYSQVLPLSWLILAVTAVVALDTLSAGDAKTAVLPVIFGQYWFVTAYVLLVLISPYLGLVAEALSRVQLQRLILIGVVMWSVMTMVDGIRLEVSNLVWFALLFMIAAYLRLHPVPGSARRWLLVGLACGVALAGALALFTALRWSALGNAADLAWPRELLSGQFALLPLAFAVALLIAAIKSPPGHSRTINYWAGASFGVYLLHDNPLVRRWLWTDLVDTPGAAGQWWLPLHAVAAIVGLYIACSVIIFALRPVLLTPALRVATAVRTQVERRLDGPQDRSESH